MKYTRSESGEVIEVQGCMKCPHMTNGFVDLKPVMFCTKSMTPGKKKSKMLTSNWTGPYHASCPLASHPEMVPELGVKK
jgi:hypothetical protein